jgi:pyridoxine 5'-phosphate synthase PdxJ
MVVLSATVIEGLHVREGELTRREEKVRISEKALVQVSITIDVKRTKAEATRQEYLDKIEAHTARGKHILGLNKMLEEKKVELDGRERDLELCMIALVEAQGQGLNP